LKPFKTFVIETDFLKGVWNVTPLIGAAIASFGNQIITTTLITFAVDNFRGRSADVGVLVNFIRQTWGFVSLFAIEIPNRK